MSKEHNKHQNKKLLINTLCVIIVMCGIIIIGSAIYMISNSKKDNTPSNNTDIVLVDNEDTNENEDSQENNQEEKVLKYYTAVFKPTKEINGNETILKNTISIIEERMTSFGMRGEGYISGEQIGISVGITDKNQENYLKYIATPGEFSMQTEDGIEILNRNMIEDTKVYIDNISKEEYPGKVSIFVKEKYIEEFKNKTKDASGKMMYIILDGNVIKFFKWESVIESGNLVLACFDREWLNALGTIMSTDVLPIQLKAVSADSTDRKK